MRQTASNTIIISICAVLLGLNAGCMSINVADLFVNNLQEVEIQKAKKWSTIEKILIVDISGVLMDRSPSGLGASPACTPDYIKAVLDKAEKDKEIEGIILRINSPGGSVAAIDSMSHEIKQFIGRTGKPCYAIILGIGASGGYHVACTAEKIYAQPSAIVGSIGVILQIPQLKKLGDKIGVEMEVVKSGPRKDIGSMFREMTDEERAVLQALVDDSYDQFLDWVIAARPAYSSRKQLEPVANGNIYSTEQALESKLIDETGYLDEVIVSMKKRVGLEDVIVVTYNYTPSADNTYYSPVGRNGGLQFNALNVNLPFNTQAGLYYVWQPGM